MECVARFCSGVMECGTRFRCLHAVAGMFWTVGPSSCSPKVSYFLPCRARGRFDSLTLSLRAGSYIERVCTLYPRGAAAALPRGCTNVAYPKVFDARTLGNVTRQDRTRCYLFCRGALPLRLNCRTLRHLLHITRSARTIVICTSRCTVQRRNHATGPLVSCRANDIHSSFSFNSLVLVHARSLGTCTQRRGMPARCGFTK